jgi:hypothetical protein
LRPAIVEKDYYATEVLRIVAATGDKVIFKGGTSLAKGSNRPLEREPLTGNSRGSAMPLARTRC